MPHAFAWYIHVGRCTDWFYFVAILHRWRRSADEALSAEPLNSAL